EMTARTKAAETNIGQRPVHIRQAVSALAAMMAMSQSCEAAALFQINNGVNVPTFTYGTALADNNVVNYAPSNIIDGSLAQTTSSTNWQGTGSGGLPAYVSIVGLDPLQSFQVTFTYLGSESGDLVRWSSTGTATTFNETDKNNNVGGATQSSHPLFATITGVN